MTVTTMKRYHCERCGYEGHADHVVGEQLSAPFCHMCNFNDALVPLNQWRCEQEAREYSREYRRGQLFKWSVIIAAVLLTVLYIATTVALIEKAKGAEIAPEAPRQVSMTLPQRCAKFHIEYHGDELWDPVTESYPRNHEWEECMGVGKR